MVIVLGNRETKNNKEFRACNKINSLNNQMKILYKLILGIFHEINFEKIEITIKIKQRKTKHFFQLHTYIKYHLQIIYTLFITPYAAMFATC